ncbi:hypothetical protein D3C85_1132410 [compost metagenome]
MLTNRQLYSKSSVNICLYRIIIGIDSLHIINTYKCAWNWYLCISSQSEDITSSIFLCPIFSFLIFQVIFYISIVSFVFLDIASNCGICRKRKNTPTVVNGMSVKYKRRFINEINFINYGRTYAQKCQLLFRVKFMLP